MSQGGEARNHEAEVEAVARAMYAQYSVPKPKHMRHAAEVIGALDAVRCAQGRDTDALRSFFARYDRLRSTDAEDFVALVEEHLRPLQGRDTDAPHEAAIDYHLLPDALPLAQCDVCRRKSWALDDVGATCSMPQPSGGPCGGEMCGRVDGLVAMVRHEAARSPQGEDHEAYHVWIGGSAGWRVFRAEDVKPVSTDPAVDAVPMRKAVDGKPLPESPT